MGNHKSYRTTMNWFYSRFEKLIVIQNNNNIALYTKDDPGSIVRIHWTGVVHYYKRFRDDLIKIVPVSKEDFEMIFSSWIENKFEVKINTIIEVTYKLYTLK